MRWRPRSRRRRPPAAAPSARELEVVHLVVPGEPDRERDGIRIHESSVRLAARTTVEGVPATDLPRTAVDLARGRSLAAALIALDSALRLLVARQVGDGPALREAVHDDALVEPARAVLRVALAELYGWPGTVIAREAIEWADPAAESAHESRSRGWFIRAGLPAAQIGVRVLGADGRWYWVDFLWDELGVVGEADGWGKYGVGEDAVAAFRAEKHRQDAIEATGRRFVRWTTEEPERAVVARVSRALGAAYLLETLLLGRFDDVSSRYAATSDVALEDRGLGQPGQALADGAGAGLADALDGLQVVDARRRAASAGRRSARPAGRRRRRAAAAPGPAAGSRAG